MITYSNYLACQRAYDNRLPDEYWDDEWYEEAEVETIPEEEEEY